MASSIFSSSDDRRAIPMAPNDALARMVVSDPRFQEFARANAGKSPWQIAREHGLDERAVSAILGARPR